MDERPNAEDYRNRAERAEAYAEELQRDLDEVMQGLEAIKAAASETLVAINGRALA